MLAETARDAAPAVAATTAAQAEAQDDSRVAAEPPSTASCSPPASTAPDLSPPKPAPPQPSPSKSTTHTEHIAWAKAFRKVDTDGSNGVSPTEIGAIIKLTLGIEMEDEAIWSVLKDFEVDGDDVIDFDEFCTFAEQHGSKNDSDTDVNALFNLISKQHGKAGSIGGEGLASLLNMLGQEVTATQAADMIWYADKDGPGRLYRDSFTPMIKAHTQAAVPGMLVSSDLHRAKHLWHDFAQLVRMLCALVGIWEYSKVMFRTVDLPVAEAHARRCFCCRILLPDSTFRQVWDIGSVPLLLYIAFAAPLRIGFDVSSETFSTGYFFDLFIDMVFIIDLALNFRTAFEDEHGVIITDGRAIACEYLGGWFWIDFVSCIPFEHIALIFVSDDATSADGGGGGSGGKLIKILRLMRLAKMFAKLSRLSGPRFTRIMNNLQHMEEKLPALLRLSVLKGFFMLICCCHWMCCVWYLVGATDQTLVDHSVTRGWVYNEHWPKGTPLGSRYVSAFFYSVTNFAPEIASTDLERGYATLQHIIYESILGYIVGTFASIAIDGKIGERKMRERIDELQDFARNHNVSVAVRNDIRHYMDKMYAHKTAFDEEALLAELPEMLRGEVTRKMHDDIVHMIPFFSGLDYQAISQLCLKIRRLGCTTKQVVVTEGEPAEDLYFIVAGILEVFIGHGAQGAERLGTLSEGMTFGEAGIFADGPTRRHSVVAATDCDIAFVPYMALRQAAQANPALDKKLRSLGQSRQTMERRARQRTSRNSQRHRRGAAGTGDGGGGGAGSDDSARRRLSAGAASQSLLQLQVLGSVPSLQALSDDVRLRLCKSCRQSEHHSGDTVARSGEASTACYIVLEGVLEERNRDSGTTLRVLSTGCYFGESCLQMGASEVLHAHDVVVTSPLCQLAALSKVNYASLAVSEGGGVTSRERWGKVKLKTRTLSALGALTPSPRP